MSLYDVLWNMPLATAHQLYLLSLQRAGHDLRQAPRPGRLRRILEALKA